jgi:hypothetical protein
MAHQLMVVAFAQTTPPAQLSQTTKKGTICVSIYLND